MARGERRRRVLLLWNFVGEDIYESMPDAEVTTVAEEIAAIETALRRSGFHVRAVNVEDDLARLEDAIRRFRPDAIFNLVEFFNDRAAQEGHVAGLFDLMGIPYTGAGPLCLQTCQRKYRTKVLLEGHGVPTPPYRRVSRLPVPARLGLGYPLIVKPAREDASGGIHADAVVRDRRALEAQVERVLVDHRQPALVERYVAGREIHAAVLGNDDPEVLPLLEIVFDKKRGRPQILTYEAKWDPDSDEFGSIEVEVPARLPAPVARRVREAALAAYRTLECRDYARVDLRVDAGGEPYVLEVNPNPDLCDGVGFMLCAEKAGRSFDDTIGALAEMALARSISGPR